MGDVEDNKRLVDVHFEVATGSPKTNGDVIGHYLDGDHRQRFTLGWIDLARHNGRTRLVFRNRQLSKPSAWSAGHQANVVSNLVEGDGQRAQRSRKLHERVMRTLHGKFVGRANEGQAGEPGDLGSGVFRKAWRRVDARPHGRASQGQAVDTLQG